VWSPDGSRIAFHAATLSGDYDIYVIDANGANVTRLTQNAARDRFPTWTPDGRIAFTTDRDGDDEVYVMNSDGTGLVRLTNSAAPDVLDSWQR